MTFITPGSVILITGATGAIGFEIAREAIAQGAIVGIHGTREERVADAIARLKAETPDAQLIGAHGDFRELGVAAAVVEQVAAAAGRLDALVHCAISVTPGATNLFSQTDPKYYSEMAASVLCVFQQLSFAAYPHLAKQRGVLIAFISDAGRYASAFQTLVGAAFGGIITFIRNLSIEAARDGIRAHAISPSYVEDTPIFEMTRQFGRSAKATKRAGLGLPTAKDLVPLTLFLCGPHSSKITGQVISVNGGLNA